MDRRFSEPLSLSDSSSGSEGESNLHEPEGDNMIQEPQPVVVPQKRAKPGSANTPHTPIPIPTVTHTVNYAISVFSSAEMRKATSKRVPRSSSFQLRTDEPWDTMKAQLLVKVSDALGDTASLDFSKYSFVISILRVISKPGLPLTSDTDYNLLVTKIKSGKLKEPILANVTITQLEGVDNKENEPAANNKTKKKAAKDPDELPGNLEKTNNIQMLQQHWKCNKRQNNCVGVYCYIDHEGNHLSLSHQRLDCWASAMVSIPSLSVYFSDGTFPQNR